MDKHIVEWVDHHLHNKEDDDLWYLCGAILDELGNRDNHRYQVGIGLSFIGGNKCHSG